MYQTIIQLITLFLLSSHTITNTPLYLNPQAATQDRVKDLMDRMTLEEKVAQMCQYVGLDHMKKAEKELSPEELLGNDALGFYKNLHSSDVAQMVVDGKIGSFLHVLTAEEANYLQSLVQITATRWLKELLYIQRQSIWRLLLRINMPMTLLVKQL
jgi:beta-glucosidase